MVCAFPHFLLWLYDNTVPTHLTDVLCTVIRAGLLIGKLSQTAQTLHVTRATARAFEREQWELLEKRLQAWKVGLANVLETVSASRKKGGASAGASAAAGASAETSATAAARCQALRSRLYGML